MPTLSHLLRFGYTLSRQSLRTDAPQWAQQRCSAAPSGHSRCAIYQPPARWNLLARVRCAFSDDATRALRAAGRWNACYSHSDDSYDIALTKFKLSASTPERAKLMVAALSDEARAKLVTQASGCLSELKDSPLLAELEQCRPEPQLTEQALTGFAVIRATQMIDLSPGAGIERTRRSEWEVSFSDVQFLRNLKPFHQAGYIYHDISLSRLAWYPGADSLTLAYHPGITTVPVGQILQAKANDERQALIAIYQSYYGDDQLKNIGEFLRALGIVFSAQKRVAQFMRDPNACLDGYIGDLTYSQKPGRAVWD